MQEIINNICQNNTQLCWDSRLIKPGNTFVALKTNNNDGHKFLLDAKNAGASSAIVEKINPSINIKQILVNDSWKTIRDIAAAYRNLFKGKIIGITGSCGKTSTKNLLALLLGNNTTKTLENENNLLGVPKTLLNINLSKDKYCVVEAGINQPGEMQKIAQTLQPDASIITNIAPVHLEGLKNKQNIANEKALLFHYTKNSGTKLLLKDHLHLNAFQKIQSQITSPPSFKITYQNNNAYINIDNIGNFQLTNRSIGMLQNATLAITMAHSLGINTNLIQQRLLNWKPDKFRGEIIKTPKNTIYIDCYNSNPTALADSQIHFSQTFNKSKNRLFILGSMSELGHNSSELHQKSLNMLHLNTHDQLILIGEEFSKTQLNSTNHSFLNNPKELRTIIANFHGHIFIKGSKKHQLWKYLP